MADIVVTVHPDGHVEVKEKVDLPPGEYLFALKYEPMHSVTLEEAKKHLPEERELTDEELAELKRAYDLLDIGAENTGLPADYADELDHYLYGTPRRNSEND